ncbi:hypothetical protein CZ814_00842 [Photobacterium toruni]|uniref:Uncharacterized protein n=1 Tax=Photobacterium toruni TaxID=1935446 RepID=A0A1T4PRM6_9GAMM|nr:hypothetical protein [Photobacterium toruni]SJZ93568.1 hypothetical protein CZ814_00842 [Photobacterium toruni]
MTPLNHSIQQSLLVSLPHSATVTTENDPLKDAKVIASKKIRFYPENESAYFDALALYRRSYNLAVERIKSDTFKDNNGKWRNLRPSIKAQVEREQAESERAYNSIVSDNGTLDAYVTLRAVIKKNKALAADKKRGLRLNENFAEVSFKSRKGAKHSFSIDRLPNGLNPCVRVLGRIDLTEPDYHYLTATVKLSPIL